MKAKKIDDTEDLKSGPQVARFIGVDPATVRRYAREGMPRHVLGAGFTRFKLSEVLEWLAQRKRKSKPANVRDIGNRKTSE
jgi:predicted DNA-binding transcriptional regulator AlpA